MPEGDTVFLAGKRLDDALAGRVLRRGELRHPRLIEHDLAGRTVLGVASVGKHLFTRFDDGRSLHSHFRMDGTWHLYRPGRSWRGPDHQIRAILATAERVAVGFRLHDLELLPTERESDLVGHLGPDLLGADWDADPDGCAAEVARRLAADPDREVGAALLDQRVACGVGNIYKTETCFLLGVSPWTRVGDLSGRQVRDAVAWARKLLLRNARRPEQSTTGDLADGAQHWVFERGGRGCRRCRDVMGRSERASQSGNIRHRWYHMYVEKTTVYLPDDLKAAVKRAAAREGVSEAEIIRQSIRRVVGDVRPRPRGGLFSSGRPAARHTDQLLSGFGER